jgi:hypothetical protein
MPLSKETYSVLNNTATGKVNIALLQREIGLSTISQEVDHIEKTSDILDIWFADTLTAPEKTTLDGYVSAHLGTETIFLFRFFEKNQMQSTTEETFQSAFNRTTVPLKKGVYIISWYCEIRVNPAGPVNSKTQIRFSINGDARGNGTSADREWVPMSGWDKVDIREGDTPQLQIEFRRDPGTGGNDTAEVRRVKLGVEVKK